MAAAVRRERRDEWRESTRGEREAEEAPRRCRGVGETGGKNSLGHRAGKLSAEEKEARPRVSSDAASRDASRAEAIRRDAEAEAANGEKSPRTPPPPLTGTTRRRRRSEAARKSARWGQRAGDDPETRSGRTSITRRNAAGKGRARSEGGDEGVRPLRLLLAKLLMIHLAV